MLVSLSSSFPCKQTTEIVGSLSPSLSHSFTLQYTTAISITGLHSVRTGAGTLHNYETSSGLRFALYTSTVTQNNSIRGALKHIYTHLWVECVIRSPLYVPSSTGKMDMASTNFEQKLDTYLGSMPWFK